MYHLRESGLNRKIKNDREKESPRLMHVVALHFTLYLSRVPPGCPNGVLRHLLWIDGVTSLGATLGSVAFEPPDHLPLRPRTREKATAGPTH